MSLSEQRWLLLTPKNTKETRDGLYPFPSALNFHPVIEDLRPDSRPVIAAGEALLHHNPNIGHVSVTCMEWAL